MKDETQLTCILVTDVTSRAFMQLGTNHPWHRRPLETILIRLTDVLDQGAQAGSGYQHMPFTQLGVAVHIFVTIISRAVGHMHFWYVLKVAWLLHDDAASLYLFYGAGAQIITA